MKHGEYIIIQYYYKEVPSPRFDESSALEGTVAFFSLLSLLSCFDWLK